MCTSPSYTIVPNKHHVSNPARLPTHPRLSLSLALPVPSAVSNLLLPSPSSPRLSLAPLGGTKLRGILARASRFYVRVTGRTRGSFSGTICSPRWWADKGKRRGRRKSGRGKGGGKWKERKRSANGEGGGVRLTWRSSNARKNLEVPRG